MNLKLDRIFIITDAMAKLGDAFLALGIDEGEVIDHKGQGTSCRRFFFADKVIELWWLRDINECQQSEARELLLAERVGLANASPLGLIFSSNSLSSHQLPFETWCYQLKGARSLFPFRIGHNVDNIFEPLCFYTSNSKLNPSKVASTNRPSIHEVQVTVAVEEFSDVLENTEFEKGFKFKKGKQHLIEIYANENLDQKNEPIDFRPELPLIIYA